MAQGRKMSFDRDHALRAAMTVFWSFGFEGASLDQLTRAMGIRSTPSLYRSFGDKKALFLEAAELYVSSYGVVVTHPLEKEKTAAEAIRGMLLAGADLYTSPGRPGGCLIVLGAVNCTPENQDIIHAMASYRLALRNMVGQRMQRAVEKGELPAAPSANALAEFYTSVLYGFAVRARDGATRDDLLAAIELVPLPGIR